MTSSLPSPENLFEFPSPPPVQPPLQQPPSRRLHFSMSESAMTHENHGAMRNKIRLTSSLRMPQSYSAHDLSDTSTSRRDEADSRAVASPKAQRRKASEIVVQKMSTINHMMSKLAARGKPYRAKESRYFRKERRATQMLAVVLGERKLFSISFVLVNYFTLEGKGG